MNDDDKKSKNTVIGVFIGSPTTVESHNNGIGMDINVIASEKQNAIGLIATSENPLRIISNGGTGIRVSVTSK